MATISPCALYQPRAKRSKSSGMRRRENHLPTIPDTNLSLQITVTTYFEKAKVQRKSPGTVENERQAIERWRDHLGHVRIDQIATPAITAYLDKRLKGRNFLRPQVAACFGANSEPRPDYASQRAQKRRWTMDICASCRE